MAWLKIQKLEYLENGTKLFYEIKKKLTRALNDTFSEVTVFVAEVTFNSTNRVLHLKNTLCTLCFRAWVGEFMHSMIFYL